MPVLTLHAFFAQIHIACFLTRIMYFTSRVKLSFATITSSDWIRRYQVTLHNPLFLHVLIKFHNVVALIACGMLLTWFGILELGIVLFFRNVSFCTSITKIIVTGIFTRKVSIDQSNLLITTVAKYRSAIRQRNTTLPLFWVLTVDHLVLIATYLVGYRSSLLSYFLLKYYLWWQNLDIWDLLLLYVHLVKLVPNVASTKLLVLFHNLEVLLLQLFVFLFFGKELLFHSF